MADYIQHGGRTPATPNTFFFPSRLSTTFPAYFCRITKLTYQTHKVLGHKHHGKLHPGWPRHRWKLPLEKTLTSLYLGFRLPFLGIYTRSNTENHLLIDVDINGTQPLEKTLNSLNLGFLLPFLGIYAGRWAIGNPITTDMLGWGAHGEGAQVSPDMMWKTRIFFYMYLRSISMCAAIFGRLIKLCMDGQCM